jgi:hypothetical protein
LNNKSPRPEERDPDHILEIKLIKVQKVPSTGHRGWCALVRKRWKAAGRKPWFLLNLLYAKETWRKSSEFFHFSRIFHRCVFFGGARWVVLTKVEVFGVFCSDGFIS